MGCSESQSRGPLPLAASAARPGACWGSSVLVSPGSQHEVWHNRDIMLLNRGVKETCPFYVCAYSTVLTKTQGGPARMEDGTTW